MTEIENLIETAKAIERNSVLDNSALSGTLETIKTMIQKRIIDDFNEIGISEFCISDFNVSIGRNGKLSIDLSGLYYRSTGNGVYAGSCDDFALSKLERDLERIVRVKMQTEIDVSVEYRLFSK